VVNMEISLNPNASAALTSIRFLLFPRGQQLSLSLPMNLSFGEVKLRLIQNWSTSFEPLVTDVGQLRLIFSGKEIGDHQTIQEVLCSCSNPSEATIHIAIKRKITIVPPIPVISNCSSSVSTATLCSFPQEIHDASVRSTGRNDVSVQTLEDSLASEVNVQPDSNIHFHGCTFDEQEMLQLNLVFNQKTDRSNNKEGIGFSDVEKFLRCYWRWMQQNQYHESNEPFPLERLDRIKEKVFKSQENQNGSDVSEGNHNRPGHSIDFHQFLEIFFLFDNNTPEHACPHGERQRVKRSTEELYKSMVVMFTSQASSEQGSSSSSSLMEIEISQNVRETTMANEFPGCCFDELFSEIDSDGDSILSCQEVELLYYLFAASSYCSFLQQNGQTHEKEQHHLNFSVPKHSH